MFHTHAVKFKQKHSMIFTNITLFILRILVDLNLEKFFNKNISILESYSYFYQYMLKKIK